MHRNTKFQLLLFLSLSFIFLSWQWPQKMIKGQILDPKSGLLIEDALIKLYTADEVLEAKSNEEGRFLFKDLEAGAYEMEIFKSGYKTAHLQAFEVYEDQPTYLLVKLTKDKPQVFSIIKED